jgi:hypothetical protein
VRSWAGAAREASMHAGGRAARPGRRIGACGAALGRERQDGEVQPYRVTERGRWRTRVPHKLINLAGVGGSRPAQATRESGRATRRAFVGMGKKERNGQQNTVEGKRRASRPVG